MAREVGVVGIGVDVGFVGLVAEVGVAFVGRREVVLVLLGDGVFVPEFLCLQVVLWNHFR